MATNRKLYFLIENCPGPFRLVMGWGHMLEKHGNRLEFELTLKPVEAGIELLGHDRKIKIPFEVALMGATTKYGHGKDEPRNARFLGRFSIPNNLAISSTAASELDDWQWEVVFNPENRSVGFVAKLDSQLPQDWTR